MKTFLPALRLFFGMTLLCGVVYPLLVFGIGRIVFGDAASGSLISGNGKVVGSRLIGQSFAGEGVFHGRPSAAGKDGYDASASSGSNAGPNNPDFLKTVGERAKAAGGEGPVPNDLALASGSGLDPHISPAAAEYQVARVARESGRTQEELRALVAKHTEPPFLGLLGDARVHVLNLNLELTGSK